MSATGEGSVPAVVLVTGVGGPAGVSVLRALAAAGHRVVGVDASAAAVGLRLAHAGAVVPDAADPHFVRALCEVARSEQASVLVPTVAEELVTLAGASAQLERAGLAHWLADPEAVEACVDKWRFHVSANEAKVVVPPTALGTHEAPTKVPGPWIVKPRFGRGSRDIVAAQRPDELEAALVAVPHPLVQHRLEGREFTVDALVDKAGRLAAAVPRWRNATKAGISVQGETFDDPELVEAVAHLLGALGLVGPANVQGFDVGTSGPDRLVFTEVNPRFSGGLPLSLAAGCDLVGQYVRGALGQGLQPEALGYRPGVRMYRYFDEVFEGPSAPR